ncbi:hypothetical protein BGX27_005252 [Mortierella sp. AM989]|nr:hypothetical protein BGX27_005252 [Mortierella sp. AM989]
MYLQQHHQQVQQQWALEQQHNQQLQAQHLQQIQMQRQNLAQDSPFGHQSSRKRGFESDESASIKKRNLGSDLTTQSLHLDATPDSPGSIMSNMSADLAAYQGGGYFDQSHFSASSSAGTSPHGIHYLGSSGLGGGASAPSTPAGIHIASSSTSGAMPSSLPRSWNSFGSHSSPPTPHVTTMPNSSGNGMNATMVATNIFSSTLSDQEPLEYRLLQEQKKLHETQMQEQQSLQMVQQQELFEMQRHQEAQSKASAMANGTGQPAFDSKPVHHDHNDPATWGYDGVSTSHFTGYLGGNGKGYTPAAIGGVAALAAMAAASRDTYGRNGGAGMDMDL